MGGASSKQARKKGGSRKTVKEQGPPPKDWGKPPEKDWGKPPDKDWGKPPPLEDGSGITSKTSSRDVEDQNRSASAKLKLLKKAKDSGSFISKKDILSFADGEYDNSAGGSAPDLRTVIPRSLRDVRPPENPSDVPHPAKWLWNHPDLTLCMDEHGNTYYYNFETEESSWDPPEDLNLPKAEITFHVIVPKNATPGLVFHVMINGTQIEVMCPLNVTPGMLLELSNDTPLLNAADHEVEEIDDDNIDSHLTGHENERGSEEVKEEVHAEPDAASIPVNSVPRTVDDETLWSALAEAAGIEVYSIMSDADTSTSILHDVANGSYFNELIYQVGWAYRFNLLKGAATECYLSGGDFLDSSLYDNCDGTPRYADKGFVQWLEDLQAQRAVLRAKIISGEFEVQEQSEDDYALLEKLSEAGDEGKLFEGLYNRRAQVEVELDNFRSRVMAVVSVEGGPTRESLDVVFNLLKGNVQCVEEDQLLDGDELEEEVSNFVQDRHRFVVDILLSVALLEEEHEILTRQIEAFEFTQRERRNAMIAGKKFEGTDGADGEEGTTENNGAKNDADDDAAHGPAVTNATLVRDPQREAIEQKQADALLALQESLAAQKEAQLGVLHEKYDRSRGIALYVASLLADGVQSISELSTCAEDSVDYIAVLEELRAECAEEEAALEALLQREETYQTQAIQQATESALMILQHERNLDSLKQSLQSARDAQQAALRERLAKRRAERVTELMDAGGVEAEAVAQAQLECAAEEEEGLAAINKEFEAKLASLTEVQLGEIKNRAEDAASRLEDSLNAHKSEQQRALMKRLERRKHQCALRIEREVAAAAAASNGGEAGGEGSGVAGVPVVITAEQKAVLLERAFARIDSEMEYEAALLEQQNIANVRQVRAQMVALVRSEHEKECERLENELQCQKDKRVKDLKARLERKKAERAKEIMQASASESNHGAATSSAVAVALASEELSEQEKVDLTSIQAETDNAVEAARKAVLDTLRELHSKETVRLEDDLKYQEKMQRTNLANRLERQKKIKEKELLAAAHAKAQAEAALSKEENNFSLEKAAAAAANLPVAPVSPRSGRLSPRAPVLSALEQSIRQQVEAEMRAIAAEEESKLQQSLDALKATHDKESAELSEELQYKKTSADKRLKDRLAQKQAKQAQAEAALQSAKIEAGLVKRRASLKPDEAVSDDPSSVTMLEAVPETPVKPSDGSVSAEEYTATTKLQQKQALERLAQFVTYEKGICIAEKQSLVKGANTKQKKEVALNELAHTSILFDHVGEFLALGLKKTFLHQTKAVKDLVQQLKPECAVGEGVRFSVEQMAQLEDGAALSTLRESACEKILERFQRDIGALLDSQALERRTTLAQMKANGSSNTQLQASRHEMTEYHSERILTEMEKVVITLTGVFVDVPMLLETNNSAHPAGVTDHADSDNEEDEDGFEAHSPSMRASLRPSARSNNSVYGARLVAWFENVMSLLKLYTTCPTALTMAFEKHCKELRVLRSSAGAALSELSAEFRPQLAKPLLQVCVQSYLCHMRRHPDNLLMAPAGEAIGSAVQQTFQQFLASGQPGADIEALFAQSRALYFDNLPAATVSNSADKTPIGALSVDKSGAQAQDLLQAYRTAVSTFVAHPVLTSAELLQYSELSHELTPMSNKSGRLSDNEARKIQLVAALNSGTERLKMEVREKYRRLGGGNEATQQQELEQLQQAQREVLDFISDDALSLEEVNADGLVAVVERKAQGQTITAEEVVDVQREVQRQKQQERAQKDVQRVLQTASESENKLDVALKIEQAKRQQALHARLMNKKKK